MGKNKDNFYGEIFQKSVTWETAMKTRG